MALVSAFLDRLADDLEMQQAYDECNEDLMNEYEDGLDDEQKRLIRYGTPAEVRDYLMNVEEVANPHVYILRMLPPR
jgi:hypothetical protein